MAEHPEARNRAAGLLTDLTAHAEALNINAAAYAEELSIEDAAAFLSRLRVVITNLRQIEGLYERWIAAIFRDQGWPTGYKKPHPVDGVGDVEVTYSSTTTWDHEGTLKAWSEKWLDEWAANHEGQLPEPWDVTAALTEVVGVSYWRVTPLKALGLDPDDYRSKSWGAAKVKITESSDDA